MDMVLTVSGAPQRSQRVLVKNESRIFPFLSWFAGARRNRAPIGGSVFECEGFAPRVDRRDTSVAEVTEIDFLPQFAFVEELAAPFAEVAGFAVFVAHLNVAVFQLRFKSQLRGALPADVLAAVDRQKDVRGRLAAIRANPIFHSCLRCSAFFVFRAAPCHPP